MGKPRDWSPDEKLAWATWELPSELAGSPDDIRHNLHEIEEYVKRQGYLVEKGLLDVLVQHSSDLRPKLRLAKSATHSLGDALADALQARPPAAPEPKPFDGDTVHKLVEAGVGVTDQHLSAVDKKAIREQAEAERQRALEQLRQGKKKLEEMQAKSECDGLVVVHRSGKGIDQNLTSQLRQVFAKFKDTGEICWVATLKARKDALTGIEKSREAPTAPPSAESVYENLIRTVRYRDGKFYRV